MKTLTLSLAVFCILMLLRTVTPAQGSTVSEAARDTLAKGIIAAGLPNYELAIAYFEEARKLAPDSPVVYYNLGLVESQVYGRELRAVAWYGAYLAASPGAANTAFVRQEITALLERNRNTASRMNKMVEAAAGQVPRNSGSLRFRELGSSSYGPGDNADTRQALAAAQQDAELIDEPVEKSRALVDVAQAQIRIGDIEGAKETLADARDYADVILNVADRRFALIDISHAQVKFGMADSSTPAKIPARQSAPAAKRPIPTFLTPADWLNILDDANAASEGSLNTGPFLDLAGYLRSMPQSDDPQRVVASLRDTVKRIAAAQDVIEQMLQRPTKK